MIALEFPEVKDCMSKLLLSETFDSFLFIEGDITTYNRFRIDGTIHKEFYDTEAQPLEDYSTWKSIREYCFSIIKGKRTPLHFQFVFSLSKANIANFLSAEGLPFQPSQVKGLYLNFKYDGKHLHCITGTSLNTFSLDKSLEHSWDAMAKRYFTKKQIPYIEI